jgi:hypothetical protein
VEKEKNETKRKEEKRKEKKRISYWLSTEVHLSTNRHYIVSLFVFPPGKDTWMVNGPSAH